MADENSQEEGRCRIRMAGLWKSETRDGKTYYSGNLGPGAQLQLWPNEYKQEGDKRPNLVLYLVKRPPKKKPAESQDESGTGDVPF